MFIHHNKININLCITFFVNYYSLKNGYDVNVCLGVFQAGVSCT